MLSELIVAGVVGVMLFFTVAVAPGIFKVLPQQWASVYVRNFFPKYYTVLGAACLIAAVIDAPHSVRMAAAASTVLFAISLWGVTPAVNAATDRGDRRRFGLLHGLSVGLNVIILVALVWALWAA